MLHLTSLINTPPTQLHHTKISPSFPRSSASSPFVTSLTCQTAHLRLIQQSQMPASFSSAATLLLPCTHIHASPTLGNRLVLESDSPDGIIENGTARTKKKKKKRQNGRETEMPHFLFTLRHLTHDA